MSKLLKELIQFFALNTSVSQDLDAYIASKNPQSISEIEHLQLQYQAGGVCGRTL